MTLSEVRAKNPQWTIVVEGSELLCIGGPWRFRAADPDDAQAGIEHRENPGAGTLGELADEMAKPGF